MTTLQYKLHLAEVIVDHLAPIREKTMYLLGHKDHLEAVLRQGCERAMVIADETVRQVDRVVGIV